MRKTNLNIPAAVCVLIMTLAGPVGADTYTVNPGESIQAAIDAASNGDEIEVAPGMYNEAINFNGKAVRMYSLFGPEVTTIDANGIAGAYHVVQCISGEDANTILEGFTITGGNANGTDSDEYGGGMYCDNSSPTVTNCKFTSNRATRYGGGMYNYTSSPIVTDCTFTGNTASLYGGGMYNRYNSNPTVTNCTFSGNRALGKGGGMYNGISSPTLINCILWGDTPDEIFDDAKSSSTVTYSDVQGGWLGAGGNNIDADPCFVDATGGDLRLSYDSPCIDAGDNSAPGLPATDLAGNRRLFDGDGDGSAIVDMGAYEFGSLKLLAHWKLDESSGDTAYDSAGENHGTLYGGPPHWHPSEGRIWGALEFDGVDDFVSIPNESNFDITHQLTVSAWIKVTAFDKGWQAIVTKGDTAWRLQRLGSSNSIVFHCNCSWGTDGSINVNNGQWHHVAGVYDGTRAYLYVDGVLDNSKPASGLIWTNDYPVMIGENAEQPGRFWNGLIDGVRIYICALSPPEVYQLYSNIHYVDADATGNNNGSSWTDAFNYLQDALAQATTPCEIRVAEGTYKPDTTSINPSGTGDRTAAFGLECGVVIKGGYAGFGQPDPNARDVDVYQTVLSGDIGIEGDNRDNCYHVVTSSGCDPNTVLEGFTITGGNANGTDSDAYGGGLYNYQSSPTLTNCKFTSNRASYGGGMYNYTSSPIVTDCTFTGNTASLYGGGINNLENSRPTVTNCTFNVNVAVDGGGMYNNYSSPTVTNCTFSGNKAQNSGGGMYNLQSNPLITDCNFTYNSVTLPTWGGGGMCNWYKSSPSVNHCTFSGNSATYGGGMYNGNSSSPAVTNCIFSGNTASTNGGGMYNFDNCTPNVTNCILWGDEPNEIFDSSNSSSTVTYSDVEGGTGQSWFGTGCIDADPCFVDAAAGNLRLKPDSPCIDAADSSILLAVPVYFDLDGKDRYVDIDSIDDTGSGPWEFLDMGAYEFNCDYTAGDNNCDGVVNFKDLAILCNNWLAGTEAE